MFLCNSKLYSPNLPPSLDPNTYQRTKTYTLIACIFMCVYIYIYVLMGSIYVRVYTHRKDPSESNRGPQQGQLLHGEPIAGDGFCKRGHDRMVIVPFVHLPYAPTIDGRISVIKMVAENNPADLEHCARRSLLSHLQCKLVSLSVQRWSDSMPTSIAPSANLNSSRQQDGRATLQGVPLSAEWATRPWTTETPEPAHSKPTPEPNSEHVHPRACTQIYEACLATYHAPYLGHWLEFQRGCSRSPTLFESGYASLLFKIRGSTSTPPTRCAQHNTISGTGVSLESGMEIWMLP